MTNIDKAVGNRIKSRRKGLKLSQTDLANHIGVKFQQVQKYESGSNRVAASRLWQIADVLRVHISYFFEDLELLETHKSGQNAPPNHAPISPDAAEFAAIFERLPDSQKQAMGAILRSLDCVSEQKATT
ncbi:transcriptional regulator, Cro/CI family [hydrothermal vent metagenome]|uniref:Transcriptional regulator, Cro/CI family n=1 Tax=hydrothermal vent metagenome TaxID=652676 RepID=A0A3B0S2B8_9ZZZZ